MQAAKRQAATVLESMATVQVNGPATSVIAAIARLPSDGEAALEAMLEWPDMEASDVLLHPTQCCGAWRQLLLTADAMVQQVSSARQTWHAMQWSPRSKAEWRQNESAQQLFSRWIRERLCELTALMVCRGRRTRRTRRPKSTQRRLSGCGLRSKWHKRQRAQLTLGQKSCWQT